MVTVSRNTLPPSPFRGLPQAPRRLLALSAVKPSTSSPPSPPCPSGSAPNWQALSTSLLERLEQPTFLVDRSGGIHAANAAFARLVGTRSVALEGQPWSALFADEDSTDTSPSFIVQGPTDLRVLSGSLFERAHWITLHLMPASHEGCGMVIAQVIEATPANTAPRSVHCESYTVSSSRHSLGMLLSTEGSTGDSQGHNSPGGFCYEALHGASGPCMGCPVFDAAPPAPARRALRPASGTQHYRIVEVVPIGEERLKVKTIRLTTAVLSELVQAKVDWIAQEGGLTTREAEVLNLLYVGRSSREIAMLLDITERTVKYHQANVLRKIGADSRVDLVRLLL
jgi:DNA-binding CsgD family transcriptional regulator